MGLCVDEKTQVTAIVHGRLPQAVPKDLRDPQGGKRVAQAIQRVAVSS